MGLAEAHYNRRGKALRLAHGNYSAHAGTGEAVNCNESFVRIRSEWSKGLEIRLKTGHYLK